MKFILNKILYCAVILLSCHGLLGQSTDLTNYLPSGYSTKGDVDYTLYLQKGIDESLDILFPNFPILINEKGLNLRSNQKLSFQAESKLIMSPNNAERYGLLNLKNIENVVISNAVLVGDKNVHLSSSGEWGMGINVLSSSNIKILNPKITDCWGDGIYIGEVHHLEVKDFNINTFFCENILIEDFFLSNNRRNGISIINVKGVVVKKGIIENTFGTAPMAGICIEPNGNGQFIDNLEFQDITFKNNKGFGIAFVPSRFYGAKSKAVNISIDNCLIEGSEKGFYFGGVTAALRNKEIKKIVGKIEVANCTLVSCDSALVTGSNQKFNPTITFKEIKILGKNSVRNFKEEKETKSLLLSRGIKMD